MPIYNEAANIGSVLREWFDCLDKVAPDFVLLAINDGSKDDTQTVLESLGSELGPRLRVVSKPNSGHGSSCREGYELALAAGAHWIFQIDSDGQCDPADFPKLLAALSEHDLVVGYRVRRADHWIRRAMSRAFRTVHRLLFPVRLRDPSCPYLIIRRPALERVLRGQVGILKQGFWWEFVARAVGCGLRVVEVPVQHRVRKAGTTQVYWPRRVPRIALEHLVGLVRLRRELRHGAAR